MNTFWTLFFLSIMTLVRLVTATKRNQMLDKPLMLLRQGVFFASYWPFHLAAMKFNQTRHISAPHQIIHRHCKQFTTVFLAACSKVTLCDLYFCKIWPHHDSFFFLTVTFADPITSKQLFQRSSQFTSLFFRHW